MSPRAEQRWKTFGTPASILIGFAGLSWSVISTVGGIVSSDLRELHSTTAIAKQTRSDFAQHLVDAQVKDDRRDDWAKDIEGDISELKVNMAKVMVKDHLADQ